MAMLREFLASIDFRAVAAVSSVVISIIALLVSLKNRKVDIAREQENALKSRVWELLSSDAGSRSVDALDKQDGKTANPIELLARTAKQLEQAGAAALAGRLTAVTAKSWSPPSPDAIGAREEFCKAVSDFMSAKKLRANS
jgi:hypothetical protein